MLNESDKSREKYDFQVTSRWYIRLCISHPHIHCFQNLIVFFRINFLLKAKTKNRKKNKEGSFIFQNKNKKFSILNKNNNVIMSHRFFFLINQIFSIFKDEIQKNKKIKRENKRQKFLFRIKPSSFQSPFVCCKKIDQFLSKKNKIKERAH